MKIVMTNTMKKIKVGINTYSFRKKRMEEVREIINSLECPYIGGYSKHIEKDDGFLIRNKLTGYYIILCDISTDEQILESLKNIKDIVNKYKTKVSHYIFIPYETNRRNRIKKLRYLYESLTALKNKLSFSISQELLFVNNDNFYFHDIEEFKKFHKTTKQNFYSYVLDTFYFKDLEEFKNIFNLLGEQVKSIHLCSIEPKTMQRNFLNRDKPYVKKIVEFLKKRKYDGFLEIEVFSNKIDLASYNEIINVLKLDKEILERLL